MKKITILIGIISVVAFTHASMAQDAEAGKKLYVDNCQICHGKEGEGDKGKKLAGDAAYWDFSIFKRTVMEGIDDEGKQMKLMPVYGKTGLIEPKGSIPTDTDLQNIQAYLKTFGPPE
jgi:mono/diheme cytochrome c family protein